MLDDKLCVPLPHCRSCRSTASSRPPCLGGYGAPTLQVDGKRGSWPVKDNSNSPSEGWESRGGPSKTPSLNMEEPGRRGSCVCASHSIGLELRGMPELVNLSDSLGSSQLSQWRTCLGSTLAVGEHDMRVVEARVAKGANESNIDCPIRRCIVPLNRNPAISRVLWGLPAIDESESMPWLGSRSRDLTLGPSSLRTGIPRF